jgi:hypothetical protein
MANLHRSGAGNLAAVGSQIPRPHGHVAGNAPSIVFRDMTVVIVAALGLAVGINIVLLLLHIGPG